MSIKLFKDKQAPLTHRELDQNFITLSGAPTSQEKTVISRPGQLPLDGWATIPAPKYIDSNKIVHTFLSDERTCVIEKHGLLYGRSGELEGIALEGKGVLSPDGNFLASGLEKGEMYFTKFGVMDWRTGCDLPDSSYKINWIVWIDEITVSALCQRGGQHDKIYTFKFNAAANKFEVVRDIEMPTGGSRYLLNDDGYLIACDDNNITIHKTDNSIKPALCNVPSQYRVFVPISFDKSTHLLKGFAYAMAPGGVAFYIITINVDSGEVVGSRDIDNEEEIVFIKMLDANKHVLSAYNAGSFKYTVTAYVEDHNKFVYSIAEDKVYLADLFAPVLLKIGM
jgi:hypothetical protein